MKFIVHISSLETDFRELKDPIAFLDRIKKREISNEEAPHKQEEFNRYLKEIRIGNKSKNKKNYWLISIGFLTYQMKLLNL